MKDFHYKRPPLDSRRFWHSQLSIASIFKVTLVFLLFTLNGEPCLSSGLSRCPGTYCGRTVVGNSLQNLTDCGKCPRGYKTDGRICQRCNSSLSLYDWLYLGFMVLLVPVVNCHFINYFESKRAIVGLLHLSSIAEGFVAVVAAILLMDPVGQFSLESCPVSSIQDWYTIFFNPKPNYVTIIRCTQEAVYPLYTISFIYHAGCLLLLFFLRQFILLFLKGVSGRKSTYATMYFLPIISVIHAIFSGLIYYSFPYLLLVASSIGTALYLAQTSDSWRKTLKRVESIVILLTYCLGNAYGMVSITLLDNPIRDSIMLIMVVMPALFYFVTCKLTNPDRYS